MTLEINKHKPTLFLLPSHHGCIHSHLAYIHVIGSSVSYCASLKTMSSHPLQSNCRLHEKYLGGNRRCFWDHSTKYRVPVYINGEINLYHSLGIFSRRQIDDIFLIFPRKQDMTFHANCLLRRQFAWNVISCFLGKIRKIFQNVVCWKFYPEC